VKIAFALVWITVVVQRLFELRLSARHEAALAKRGGFAVPGSRLLPIVIAHTLWLGLWAWEVMALHARSPAAWPVLAAVAVAAEGLRWWAIASLGPRWTTRVFALPGQPLVTAGPYRWLSHPNYLAVAALTLALPLVFGAWRAAVLGLTLYLFTLALRLPAERRAMALAASGTLDRDSAKP
jgi:methyltransferase